MPDAAAQAQAEALRAAVLAAPDDDRPRLVFADWLQERADPRGEFIQVQCALARLAADDPQRPTLLARERALMPPERDIGRFGRVRCERHYERGFVGRAAFGVDVLLDGGAAALLATEPIEALRVYPPPQTGVFPSLSRHQETTVLGMLLGLPGLERLTSLALPYHRLEASAVAQLAACTRLGALRCLDVGHNEITDAALRAICGAPHLQGLVALAAGGLITAAGVATLGASALRLTELSLAANPGFDAGGVRALAAWPALAALRALDLGGTNVGAEGAATLAATPALATLDLLVLADTGIGAAGLAALCASPHLSPTLQLVLDGDTLGLRVSEGWDQGVLVDQRWEGPIPAHVLARFPRTSHTSWHGSRAWIPALPLLGAN